jgi:hypothetical protein
LAITRIVILNRCHHLLKEEISSNPCPQPGAPLRPACAVPSAPTPQALEKSLPFYQPVTRSVDRDRSLREQISLSETLRFMFGSAGVL